MPPRAAHCSASCCSASAPATCRCPSRRSTPSSEAREPRPPRARCPVAPERSCCASADRRRPGGRICGVWARRVGRRGALRPPCDRGVDSRPARSRRRLPRSRARRSARAPRRGTPSSVFAGTASRGRCRRGSRCRRGGRGHGDDRRRKHVLTIADGDRERARFAGGEDRGCGPIRHGRCHRGRAARRERAARCAVQPERCRLEPTEPGGRDGGRRAGRDRRGLGGQFGRRPTERRR